MAKKLPVKQKYINDVLEFIFNVRVINISALEIIFPEKKLKKTLLQLFKEGYIYIGVGDARHNF